MTSRLTAAPQRSVSGTSVIQRPALQRGPSSQQYLSTASSQDSSFVDLTFDGGNASAHGRPGSVTPAASRLRVDSGMEAASPLAFQPSPLTNVPATDPEPRGRPQLFSFLGREEISWEGSTIAQSLISTPGMDQQTRCGPMPMPKRPGRNIQLSAKSKKPIALPVLKRDARPKPYTLEVPIAAPRYPPNGHIDFYPWTGNHPEDQFTDHIIRQGYFDKAPVTLQRETDTARLAIFPGMKQKSGLVTLSGLFTNILAQRRAHGQITAPPTFKPPPRVTLTDTRRETWLKDLANPATSLRRLSRTIPHGIRGKSLLEHCWAKRIPTERAVWLAKCVGANEIRATKRKGASGTLLMGGEMKWIREWTGFVEQFVEGAVAACGDADWKERISYAVRLAAHLYSEHLLDRDHYMDWVSASLETSTLARLPMWLLNTQVYWKDLLRFRKQGRRLVATLCSHLRATHESPDRDLLTPLTDRLVTLLDGLIQSYPDNFVSPKAWTKEKEILQACLPFDNPTISVSLVDIELRNSRLLCRKSDAAHDPRHELVKLLDRSLLEPFDSGLAKKCWQLPIQKPILVNAIVEWATSLYRPGLAKIYVGARLLRNWSRSGIDINDAILGFLGSEAASSQCSTTSIYHLISELERSKHFSPTRYLQWLIARGGIRGSLDLADDAPCTSRLLAELPISDLPENIERLRSTILARADFSTEDEETALELELARLRRLLPGLPVDGDDDAMDFENNDTQPSILAASGPSRTIKSEMGLWLRTTVKNHVVTPKLRESSDAWKEDDAITEKSAITSGEFVIIRGVLETIEDMSILADVLKIVSSSDNIGVLASVADTLNRHLETFSAIGALNDLFDILLARMPFSFGRHDVTSITFLSSMAELAARMSSVETATRLAQYLARSYSKTAAEACSPVSDEMAEALQTTKADFSDEIEKVLASGNSMDASTLGRLFSTIVLRLESSWSKDSAQQKKCGTLLSRLRSFDTKHFDGLFNKWFIDFVARSERPTLNQVLVPLIGQGCVGLVTILDHCSTLLDDGSGLVRMVEETLDLLLGLSEPSSGMTVEEAYHTEIKRLKMQRELPEKSLSIVRSAIIRTGSLGKADKEKVMLLVMSDKARSFLQGIVLADLDVANKHLVAPLSASSNSAVQSAIADVVKSLVVPTKQDSGGVSTSTTDSISKVMYRANDLTLPFCQLELQVIFASSTPEFAAGDSAKDSGLEAFEGAVDTAVAAGNSTWIGLVKILDPKIARHLCERAERTFFQALPGGKSLGGGDEVKDTAEDARRALYVCEATSYSIQPMRAIHTSAQVVEKCNDFWTLLSTDNITSKQSLMDTYIPLLLDFVKTQSTIPLDASKGTESRTRLLLSLSSLLLQLQKSNVPSLLQHTFDTLLLLVDGLPNDDSRQACIRALKTKTADPRLCYIFGYSKPPMDWLVANQKAAGGPSGPTGTFTMGAGWIGSAGTKTTPYVVKRWECLSEPTPNVGENDTSLSLTLFGARKVGHV